MADSILLQTKLLIPRFPASHVTRPHLVAMLRGYQDRRLVIVSAPAGYGKTTLVAELVIAYDQPVLWYQLDGNDNDPSTFIAYLLGGLRQSRPDVSEKLDQLLLASGPHPPERALIIVLNELLEKPGQRWILVLDDYHLITNPAVHRLTEMLVENQPAGMQIILAARNHPPLPLARWRGRGWLAEIREAHLRFSTQEVLDWLEKGQDAANMLTIPLVDLLVEKTEGWGVGLQLAMALLAESRTDAARLVARLDGQHPYIFNYLMEEVFERQPAAIQDFLLQSSILDQLNARVCQVVIGAENPQHFLDTLIQENLFVVQLDEQWYRYHHLFREFLMNRLVQRHPDWITRLHISAGDYYLSQHDYQSATQYFLFAGDQPQAAAVLSHVANKLLDEGRLDVLNRYLRQLDAVVLDAHPDLLLIFGNIQRYMGLLKEASDYLQRLLVVSANPEDQAAALTVLASIARSQGDYRRGQQLAAQAVTVAAPISSATRAFALMELAKCQGSLEGMDKGRALAEDAVAEMRKAGEAISLHRRAQLLRSLGQICWWHGDVKMAVAHCQEALHCLSADESPLRAEILVTLATPCLYRHEYQAALDYAEQALKIAEHLQLKELLPASYTVLGNILTRLSQFARAEGCLRKAIDLATALGAARYDQVMAGGYLGYNLVAQGRIDEARQIVETALWSDQDKAMVYEVYVSRSVLADIHLENKQFREAAHIFEDLIALGKARQYRIPLAMALFGLAYIRLVEEQQAEGATLAQDSLALIEPPNVWELYVDQGTRAQVVCQALLAVAPQDRFIAQVMQALQEKQPTVSPLLVADTRIRVQTLGSLRVFHGSQEIDPKRWASAKARDLLAFFVTFRHEYMPLDRITDGLWVAETTDGPSAFHTALYRLRHALRLPGETAKYIQVAGGEYSLDITHFEIDVDRFDQYVRQAATTKNYEAIHFQELAVDLYHGDYLNNLYYDWTVSERQRLSASYVRVLRSLAKYYANNDRAEEALTLSKRALVADPLAEDLHCDVMRYLNAVGDRSGLNKQYAALFAMLHEELGIAPSLDTQRLFVSLGGQIGY